MSRTTYYIEDADQLRAVASPVRHRIMGAFEALGRTTVRDLAEYLRVAPESLYYHVKALVESGLVVEAGKRPTERRLAQLYEVVSRDLEVRIEGSSPAYRDAYADLGSGLLRWADRAHRAALEDPDVRQSGAGRQRTLIQLHARLNEESLAELNRRLEAIVDLLQDEDSDGTPYAVTLVNSPTETASP